MQKIELLTDLRKFSSLSLLVSPISPLRPWISHLRPLSSHLTLGLLITPLGLPTCQLRPQIIDGQEDGKTNEGPPLFYVGSPFFYKILSSFAAMLPPTQLFSQTKQGNRYRWPLIALVWLVQLMYLSFCRRTFSGLELRQLESSKFISRSKIWILKSSTSEDKGNYQLH